MMTNHFYNFKKYALIEDESIPIPSGIDSSKEVMVLCKKTDLTGPNRELLEKILNAIGQNMTSTQIVGVNDDEKINVSQLLHIGSPNTLLSFEINLNKNGLNLKQKLYKLIKLLDTTIIISESLSQLQNKVEAKKKLWATLQLHFKNSSA